jgi:hypothetical protein
MLIQTDNILYLAAINANLGYRCMNVSDFVNALIYFDTSIEQNPNVAAVHWCKANSLLNLGRYPEGFTEFEKRWGYVGWHWKTIKRPEPVEKDIAGKKILLVHDAGRGDAIMMMRYVPRLRATGADITILVFPELKRLFELAFEGIKIITEPPTILFDCVIPMFSLAYVFDDTTATVPRAPYLKVAAKSCGRSIGICWSGVSQRSLSLQKFLSLLQVDGNKLQALQPGPVTDGVQPFSYEADFLDLAETIMGLEHIITVDTALVNLCGALGHPSTHLFLHYIMDFRWWRPEVWYPTVQCYRQSQRAEYLDDWSVQFEQIRNRIS